MSSRKQLVAWLNEAHAMERCLVRVLEDHVKDANDFPEIQICLAQHVEETKGHASKLEQCLRILGESPSKSNGVTGSVTDALRTKTTCIFRDEIVKNLLSDYATEHMEIGSYIALTIAAEELGQFEIVDLCQEILEEEQEMAEWLEEQLPHVTRQALHREGPLTAARERPRLPGRVEPAHAHLHLISSAPSTHEKRSHKITDQDRRFHTQRG